MVETNARRNYFLLRVSVSYLHLTTLKYQSVTSLKLFGKYNLCFLII